MALYLAYNTMYCWSFLTLVIYVITLKKRKEKKEKKDFVRPKLTPKKFNWLKNPDFLLCNQVRNILLIQRHLSFLIN